jgi:hypothetical protein
LTEVNPVRLRCTLMHEYGDAYRLSTIGYRLSHSSEALE